MRYLYKISSSIDSLFTIYPFPKNYYYIFNSLINKINKLEYQENNVQNSLLLIDKLFKNPGLNYLAKAKILETEILFNNNLQQVKDLQTIFFNNERNKQNIYYPLLAEIYAKRLKTDVGGVPENVELTDKDGNKKHLYDYKGSYIYLAFGGTWCPPCMEELNLIQETIKGKNLKGIFLVVFLEKDIETWKKFIKKIEKNILCFVILDGWNSEILNKFMVKGVPKSFLLDPELKIVKTSSGFDEKEIKETLNKYILLEKIK